MKVVRRLTLLSSALLFLVVGNSMSVKAELHPSYSSKAVIDTVPFYDTSTYDQTVPKPNDYFTEPFGSWPSRYYEIRSYLKALADNSDRVLIEQHGTTHEGRTLVHLVISTPENIRNLDSLRTHMDKIAEPANTITDSDLESQPAFAWLAYSIHGDEMSGSDAAVAMAYHLAAANDSATLHLLENVVIIIDPCENPDGRERYLSMLQTYKSYVPNYDAQSLQHSGVWPWGRTNHYLFDLNRDWILLTQPETIGRVKTILKYHPVLGVDAHEMGAYATYLFSPPREPINYNTPDNVMKWYEVFRNDQARAFDEHGWSYYTGEWNEQWYIGYGSAWPTFFGTVGILYEQAGVDGGMVKQRDDYILTYHESVNHQFTSSLANLQTVANNRVALLRDYHNARQAIVNKGKKNGLTFLFVPDDDQVKMNRFIRSLIEQDIKVYKATEKFTVSSATDIYHTTYSSKQFPAGTYIVSTAQPQGALAKAILEFDLHLKKSFLEEERRELEKGRGSRMYEISAWSVPMGYNLDAYYTKSRIQVAQEPVTTLTEPTGQLTNSSARYGFLIDMEGELTYRILNSLFARGLYVYVSEKPFTVEGRAYKAGTLLLRKRGNPDNLPDILTRLAQEVGINVFGVNTGLSTKGSQLGAPTFRLLKQPKVALVFGSPFGNTSVGSMWFTIDKQLEMPHSLVSSNELLYTDLSPYNVLIVPSSWGGLHQVLGKQGKQKLSEWVKNGGVLILSGSSAAWAADTMTALSQVRLKRQMIDKLDKYSRILERELAADSPVVDTMELWHPEKIPAEEQPAREDKAGGMGKMSKDEMQEYDRWQQRFYPRGVILAADIDTEDWLAFGLKKRMPVMSYTRNAFLAGESVKTVARLTPEETKLRLSGLLWPEARQRWAGTAYVTRERHGKGQIIMFAGEPFMRAYWYGTRQMFVNALLYGPGFTQGGAPYEKQK